MKARLAIAVALSLVVPVAALADENPWTALKKILREPVADIKKQLEQIRPPGQTQESSSEPPAAAGTVPPKPVARPSPDSSASPALEDDQPPANAVLAVEPETTSPTTAGAEAGGPAGVPTLTPPSGPAPAAGTLVPPVNAAAVATPVDKVAPKTPSAVPQALATALAPIPRPRPETAIPYAATGLESPAASSAAAIGALVAPPPLPPLTKPPPAARSTCGVALARLGVEATAIAPIHEGACGIAQPVAVASLGGGAVDLTAKAIVGCQLAEAFADWLGDDVQPAARQYLGGDVVGLRVAASYVCRTRNNAAGAKLSEHGRGSAIDISAFRVAGRGWIAVGGNHSLAEARFMTAIRKAACGPFTTVLGPGSDAHHNDHFHFDLAKRNKRGKSRGLYCR